MEFSANDADTIVFSQKEERERGRKEGFLPQILHKNHYLVNYKLRIKEQTFKSFRIKHGRLYSSY